MIPEPQPSPKQVPSHASSHVCSAGYSVPHFPLTRFEFLLAGRLFQVEYAMEAINNGAACIGVMAKDGIVIATQVNIARAQCSYTVILTLLRALICGVTESGC